MKTKIHKVELEFEEVDSCLQCGFRIQWLNGETKEKKVQLDCGAGVGSPWLIFTKTVNGKERTIIYDIRKLIPILDKLV